MATGAEYDASLKALEALAADYVNVRSNLNEATTRFRIIDRLFLDVLRWDRSDFSIERHHNGEYTDYEFTYPRRFLIVEAKRDGVAFQLPLGLTGLKHRLSNLRRENPVLAAALDQVSEYCRKRGVPLAAVSNGPQLVLFAPVRTDGIPPEEGHAFAFQSLAVMEEEFRTLWDFLAKPAIENQALLRALVSGDTGAIPPKISTTIPQYPGIRDRDLLQADLRIISEIVFDGSPRDAALEAEFLRQCYCRTGALSQYASASKQILRARYAGIFESNQARPTVVSATNKKGLNPDIVEIPNSLSRRPILLIGDVGVGKTTFIRNLMIVDDEHVFAKSIAFYIDLGAGATLSKVSDFVLNEIELQLVQQGIDPYEDGIVRGIYNFELKRFAKGIYKALAETDEAVYAKEELAFLKEKLGDRPRHLAATIEHIVKARRRQVVIFIDNADQRDDLVQQEAFLVAQELAANWPATVFLTLRPETFHASTRRGALSGYHPKAFTIEPPRIDETLRARIRFAKRLTKGEIQLVGVAQVGIQVEALHTLLEVIERSLESGRELITCIESISRGNVRMAIQILSDFCGNAHVNSSRIISKAGQIGAYRVRLWELLAAIIYGESEYYDPERSPIANIFDVYRNDPKEHFLLPILLSFLKQPGGLASESGFVESGPVYQRIQGFGFTPDQIDQAMLKALKSGLAETVGRRIGDSDVARSTAFRITSRGDYLVTHLCGMITYLDAVIVDTPIFDETARRGLRNVGAIKEVGERARRVATFVQYLNSVWDSASLSESDFPWSERSAHAFEEIGRVQSSLAQRNINY